MKSSRCVLSVFAVALAILCAAPAGAADIDVAIGLSSAIGVAADPTGNAIYFVERNGGTLKRVATTPGCTPTTCAPVTIASGFSLPHDVALDFVQNVAYVTTQLDVGTTGNLWRVDLATGAKQLVTFNLETPHQMALDLATNSAYVVGSAAPGRLWKIQLDSGSKTTVISGLGQPVGLAVTSDRTRAYIAEQSPNKQIAEIDIATGARIRNVATGLTNPFFLRWTDPSETALFVTQRDGANNVKRLDLATTLLVDAMSGTPPWFRPSSVAVDLPGAKVYVATDTKVVAVKRADLPDVPVFFGVGHIASTDIDTNGYATASNLLIHVVDAPFGGTTDIFGNFANFTALGATHYRVMMSQDGGVSFNPLVLSWNAEQWSLSTMRFEATPVAPVAGATLPGLYAIPAQPELWRPAFLMMRWPSGANGTYAFKVEIYQSNNAPTPVYADRTHLLAIQNSLTLKVDNDLPAVDLVHIYLKANPDSSWIAPCAFVNAGANLYDVMITAADANGHMGSYIVRAYWGKNGSAVVTSDSYAPSHVDQDGANLWKGISNTRKPTSGWAAKCNCAHTFYLDAWKRTTNGYHAIKRGISHQSITIQNTGITTCGGS